MIADTLTTDLTWRLLWAHTAQRVVSALPDNTSWTLVSAGYGWGLRREDNDRCALLLHPSSNDREFGDLSLTVLGKGTHTIPRAGHSYSNYIALVEDAVVTAAHFYLQ